MLLGIMTALPLTTDGFPSGGNIAMAKSIDLTGIAMEGYHKEDSKNREVSIPIQSETPKNETETKELPPMEINNKPANGKDEVALQTQKEQSESDTENTIETEKEKPTTKKEETITSKKKGFSNVYYSQYGEPIYDISGKQVEKIKWKDEYISIYFQAKDSGAKVKESTYGREYIENFIAKGISGDFLSIRKTKEGLLPTKYGNYTYALSVDHKGNRTSLLYKKEIEETKEEGKNPFTMERDISKSLFIKEIDKKHGLLYGKFENMDSNLMALGLDEHDNIGIAKIETKGFLKAQDKIDIRVKEEYKYKTDAPIGKVSFQKEVIPLEEENENGEKVVKETYQNGIFEQEGEVDLQLRLFQQKTGRLYVLTDAENNIMFTKLLDKEKGIGEIFYVDFDNQYDKSKAKIVHVGRFYLKDFWA